MIEMLKLGADGGSGAFKGDGGTGSQKRSNEGNEENDFSFCSVASF